MARARAAAPISQSAKSLAASARYLDGTESRPERPVASPSPSASRPQTMPAMSGIIAPKNCTKASAPIDASQGA